jgi:hypothetical protein
MVKKQKISTDSTEKIRVISKICERLKKVQHKRDFKIQWSKIVINYKKIPTDFTNPTDKVNINISINICENP